MLSLHFYSDDVSTFWQLDCSGCPPAEDYQSSSSPRRRLILVSHEVEDGMRS